MYQVKQQLDCSKSFFDQTKKLQTTFDKENILINCIENLSDELFYEIFDYLDGCDIYKAFLNLNFRLQHLITSSLFLLKIKFRPKTTLELLELCGNIIFPNRHRIISFHLENKLLVNDFFIYFTIDSSFNCLRSIVLKDVETSRSSLFLFYLKSLPHLLSLTMYIDPQLDCDFYNIYRMIFSFPCLKYNKLSLCSCSQYKYMNIIAPRAINEKFSTIEYLVIDHRCTFYELFTIIQHTPRLHHLTCKKLFKSSNQLGNQNHIRLSNLTHINIDMYEILFDDFTMFMTKLFAPVQILSIKCLTGAHYLDAKDWEYLIKTRIPYLRRFNYESHVCCPFYFEDNSYYMKINQFTSPFWTQRRWFAEFSISMNDEHFNYSIHPYRNLWLEIYKHLEVISFFGPRIIMGRQQDINKSLTESIPIIQLSINGNFSDEQNQMFIDKFKSRFVTVQFTRLNINCKNISIGILIRLTHLLPNLNSLKVLHLPLIQSDWLFDNDAEIRFLTWINNKITHVNLENVNNIQQVHFILYLCPWIKYFQLDLTENMDLTMLGTFILIKANTNTPHLNCLCLSFPNVNNDMVHQLQNTIKSKKLLSNYHIKCIYNNILLKWN
ncbi:unnamed protein product [Rotaria sp. Silwood1]|nr:unnamed protein product [Rotaria sp. Silwood1]CAF3710753.1 unnamed protein product [Rotaria sp. Silwood1]CAF4682327.1 unnamed protein product [Rotaria sp. Silwood1]CAF5014003.1 unnamed protein product [Rotaria sp. Silwood1]